MYVPFNISYQLCPPSLDKYVLISYVSKYKPVFPVPIIIPTAYSLLYINDYVTVLPYKCKLQSPLQFNG
jgi:hypothetical protein